MFHNLFQNAKFRQKIWVFFMKQTLKRFLTNFLHFDFFIVTSSCLLEGKELMDYTIPLCEHDSSIFRTKKKSPDYPFPEIDVFKTSQWLQSFYIDFFISLFGRHWSIAKIMNSNEQLSLKKINLLYKLILKYMTFDLTFIGYLLILQTCREKTVWRSETLTEWLLKDFTCCRKSFAEKVATLGCL